jgi:hypothetical protein
MAETLYSQILESKKKWSLVIWTIMP